MAAVEIELVNAICNNKEISSALVANVDDLFSPTWKPVWDWLKGYYNSYKSVPDISIVKKEFPEFDIVESTGAVGHYISKLREKYTDEKVKGLLVNASKAIKSESPILVAQKMAGELAKINRQANTARDLDITDIDDALIHYQSVREKSDMMGGMPGIPTGLISIDTAYPTGCAPGHLIVIIGWPARAKTWIAGLMAVNAWKRGFKPMMISMEMSPEGTRDRLYGMLGDGRFSVSGFSRGDVDLDHVNEKFRKDFENKQGFVVISQEGVNEMTPNMVQSKIDQHKPDMVILDYHQLFLDNERSSGATERNMNLGRQFKGLARSNNIPIVDIVAATAKPGADLSKPPLLSDVAWSKSIEYDADMAFSVHRHDGSEITQIDGVKNRWGPLFSFYLKSNFDKGVFTEEFSLQ